MTDTPDVIPDISVTVKNWPDSWAKPPVISRTTVKTYTIDPAASPLDNNARRTQIAEYEPNRKRMVIQVIDASVMLCAEVPVESPDTSTVADPGVGRYLPNSLNVEYVLYGPDAWWINSLAAATRVTVTKEYC